MQAWIKKEFHVDAPNTQEVTYWPAQQARSASLNKLHMQGLMWECRRVSPVEYLYWTLFNKIYPIIFFAFLCFYKFYLFLIEG